MTKLYPAKATKPLKAIRLFCGECMGMDRRKKKKTYPLTDVAGCTDELCPLYEWRFGKHPFVRRTPKQAEATRKLAEKYAYRRGSKGKI